MAAGVNKLHLPLVAWPTHPQCHVVEGRAVTKEAPQPQNAILFTHTDPSSKGLGQDNLPRAVTGAGQDTGLQPVFSCSFRNRLAAVAWPLHGGGAWTCAPTPFLTELYAGYVGGGRKRASKVL